MLNSKFYFTATIAATLLFSSVALSMGKTGASPAKEEVAKLTATLKSDAPQKEKADACRELARIGTKEAVAPLAALLGDEKLTHMARYGLETIPDPAVDKAFREALLHLQGRPLVGVIGSIGMRHDAKAVDALAKLLQDSDAEVAQAAARALGKIATPAAAQAMKKALATVPAASQLAFCEGLLRCAEAFAAKGQQRRATAIYDHLRSLEVPHQVRTAAMRGAVLTRQANGLPLLQQALQSDNFATFATAIRIAFEIPGSEVTRVLTADLQKTAPDKQLLIIQVLGQRADVAALPALFNCARNCEKPVRIAAIRALAQLGDPSAAPGLVDLLGEADHTIAQAAQESLASLPGKGVDAAVMAMLSSGKSERCITGLELIARRRMTSAAPAVFKAAGGQDPQVRIVAVRKLGEIAGPSELPGLLDLLAKARTSEDREAAEQAVSTLCVKAPNPDACVETLQGRMAQALPAQKCALLRVLTAVGGANALKIVRAAAKDSNAEVHAAAIRSLGGWNSSDVAPDLLELARTASDPTEKMLCLRGYLGFAGHADLPQDKRLAMCREAAGLVQKADEKKLLLSALGGINSVDALALIQPYLAEDATKEEASSATVSIADVLLKGKDASKDAPSLVQPLQKAAETTANEDLAKRANTLLQQARDKAGTK